MFFSLLIAILGVGLINASATPSFENSFVIDVSPEDFQNAMAKHPPVQFQMDHQSLNELRTLLNNNVTETLSANLNDYLDQVVANIDSYMKLKNYDPLSLPDIYESVTYNLLWLIPYTGSLTMDRGSLQGSSSAYRKGDASISYNTDVKYLNFKTLISFQTMKFSYIYYLHIPLIFSSRGECTGGVTDMDISVGIGVNFDTGLITLDDFSIPDSGHISIHFHTYSILPNWSVNLLLDAVTAILKDYILEALASVVRNPLVAIIDVLNKITQSAISF